MGLSNEEKLKRKQERQQKVYDETHRALENGDIEKLCTICNQWLPFSEKYFYKNKANTIDGLNPYCKECTKAKSKKWGEDNLERKRELANRYVPDKTRQRQLSQNRRDNGKHKQWMKENKEKLKGYRLKYEANKTHIMNENEWISCKTYFNNSCAYCGLPIEEHFKRYSGIFKNTDLHKEHVDHEGTNDLSNCVPACHWCNSSKKKREMEEWYRKQEFFTQEKLDKINKWLEEDYKLYIEEHKPKEKGKYIKKNKEYWKNN
jgi:hypothetical protein